MIKEFQTHKILSKKWIVNNNNKILKTMKKTHNIKSKF